MPLAFVETFADQRPYFLPDTTPVVSYAAFQLLAFAMQRDNGCKGGSWDKVLDNAILGPLNMTSSGVLGSDVDDIFAIDGFNTSQIGEPA